MAKIRFSGTAGASYSAVIVRDADGYVCDPTPTPTFAAPAAVTRAQAEIPLTTVGGEWPERFEADVPALPEGAYTVEVYERSGATLALSDGGPVGEGTVAWDGEAEVTLQAVNARTKNLPAAPAAVADVQPRIRVEIPG